MALIESDVQVTGDNTASRLIRGAIVDELSATNLYEKLIALLPSYKDELTEIMTDEMEHTGKLLKILNSIVPLQTEAMNRGIEGA